MAKAKKKKVNKVMNKKAAKKNKMNTRKKMSNRKNLSAKASSKKSKVSPIPKNEHTVTAYLILNNANSTIQFYKNIFGAKELMRMQMPDGKIGHAEIRIGDTKIMVGDECPEMQAFAPGQSAKSPVSMHLYVKNVDATVEKALKNGAKLIRNIEDMFYGDRAGMIEDPSGHKWYIATHIEDVSPRELKKRAQQLFSNQADGGHKSWSNKSSNKSDRDKSESLYDDSSKSYKDEPETFS